MRRKTGVNSLEDLRWIISLEVFYRQDTRDGGILVVCDFCSRFESKSNRYFSLVYQLINGITRLQLSE